MAIKRQLSSLLGPAHSLHSGTSNPCGASPAKLFVFYHIPLTPRLWRLSKSIHEEQLEKSLGLSLKSPPALTASGLGGATSCWIFSNQLRGRISWVTMPKKITLAVLKPINLTQGTIIGQLVSLSVSTFRWHRSWRLCQGSKTESEKTRTRAVRI